jgi:type I restriction enzyme S subunit
MIPEGWTEHELGEIATFKGGCGFKEVYQGKTSGEWPFIKVSDMNLLGNEQEIFYSQNWVDQPEAKAMRASPMPARAIVFAKVGAALMLNRRRRLTRPTIIDNNMMAAIPDEGVITSDFLLLHLKTVDLGKFAQASAVPSVNQQHLSELEIILPPPPRAAADYRDFRVLGSRHCDGGSPDRQRPHPEKGADPNNPDRQTPPAGV